MKSTLKAFFLLGFTMLLLCCNTTKEDSEQTDTLVGEEAVRKYTLFLSIDGGGVKGIVPATILAQLEKDLGKPIYELFDVIGGTSTGGIISIGLTTPKLPSSTRATVPRTAAEIQQIYLQNCGEILYPNKYQTGPYYYAESGGSPSVGIEPFLQGLVGQSYTMKQAHDNMVNLPNSRVREVFTTCYIVNSNGGKHTSVTKGVDYGPYQFTWSKAINSSINENYYVWEAARGTSAAPIFFPIANVGGGKHKRSSADEKWVIDGGVVTNNPVITGLEFIRKRQGTLDNVVAISLGCGINPFNGGVGVTNQAVNYQPYGQKYGFWNSTNWIVEDLYNLAEDDAGRGRLIELLMFANQFTADSQLENMIQTSAIKDGVRIQPMLPQNINQSFDCSVVGQLQQATIHYITQDSIGVAEYTKLKNLIHQYH